ncbi:hypothetical protein D3C72_844660 [compost metagenome]
MTTTDTPAPLSDDELLASAAQGFAAATGQPVEAIAAGLADVVETFAPSPDLAQVAEALGVVDEPVEPEDTLEDLLVELPEERRRAFAVETEEDADWVVDKLLSMDERIARYKRQMAARLAAMTNDRQRFAGRFVPQLKEWAEARRPDKTKPKGAKFLDLDAGRVGFRMNPRRASVADEAQAIAYLVDHGELVDLLRDDATTFDDVLAYMAPRPAFAELHEQATAIAHESGEEDALAFLSDAVEPDLATLVSVETVTNLDADALRKRALASARAAAIPGVAIIEAAEDFYFQAPAKPKA